MSIEQQNRQSSEKMVDGKKEGDWACAGCKNNNYAFRSFCNRCKLPRILVDTKTPSDSKWLPRAGDWICTGCTNNNYASRENCKKCGESKEVAAMPAVGLPGASFPIHPLYFPRGQGTVDQRMNFGHLGAAASQLPLPFASNWLLGLGGVDKVRSPSSSSWHSLGPQTSGFLFANNLQMFPKGWRNGDWICNCGFHNYANRTQCKKCDASAPPVLGTKRLASEEPAHDWESKRLNAGVGAVDDDFILTNRLLQTYPGMEQTSLPEPNLRTEIQPHFSQGEHPAIPNFQMRFPFLELAPSHLGKGSTKHWRQGDWMCSRCNNHNYASRSQCNRCKTEKEAPAHSTSQPVNAA